MKAYYDLLNHLKTTLEADKYINGVTYGSIEDVDFTKTSLYPLVHFGVTNAVIAQGTINFEMSILVMDIVSQTNYAEQEPGSVWLVNNEQHVLNETLGIMNKTIKTFKKGVSSRQGFIIDENEIDCEAFKDRFNDDVAGWITSFTIKIPNTAEFCTPILRGLSLTVDYGTEIMNLQYNRVLSSTIDTSKTVTIKKVDDDSLIASFQLSSAQAVAASGDTLRIDYGGATMSDSERISMTANDWYVLIEADAVSDAYSGVGNVAVESKYGPFIKFNNPPQLVDYNYDFDNKIISLIFDGKVDCGNGLDTTASFYTIENDFIASFDLCNFINDGINKLTLNIVSQSDEIKDKFANNSTYVELPEGSIVDDSGGRDQNNHIQAVSGNLGFNEHVYITDQLRPQSFTVNQQATSIILQFNKAIEAVDLSSPTFQIRNAENDAILLTGPLSFSGTVSVISQQITIDYSTSPLPIDSYVGSLNRPSIYLELGAGAVAEKDRAENINVELLRQTKWNATIENFPRVSNPSYDSFNQKYIIPFTDAVTIDEGETSFPGSTGFITILDDNGAAIAGGGLGFYTINFNQLEIDVSGAPAEIKNILQNENTYVEHGFGAFRNEDYIHTQQLTGKQSYNQTFYGS